ncbi:hypothetical protein B0H13DRAFT_2025421, partial [Mycena leptocephala]
MDVAAAAPPSSLSYLIAPGLPRGYLPAILLPREPAIMPASSALTTLATLFLLATSAAAQATTLPQCAQGCANQAATKVGCSLSDTACLCKTSFTSTVLQCAGTTSCSPADQTQVSTILEGMCAIVSSSAPTSSAPVSTSRSGSVSVSIAPPGSSPPSVSLTQTIITSTVISVSPPKTTTFTTSVPISNTLVPPPISLSSTFSLPSSVPTFSTPTTPSFSAPSTSPSTAAAVGRKVGAAGMAGALLRLGCGFC